MHRSITTRTIAKAAGVSQTTVSFVLNHRRDIAIPDATRQRVLDTADKLGWRPNHMLSALSTGRTRLIGLWSSVLDEPYHTTVFHCLEALLREDGYAVLISPARKQGYHEFDLGMFAKWAVDGLIALDAPKHAIHFLKEHPEWQVPMLCMDSFERVHGTAMDEVYVNVLPAVREALEYLLKTGHRRIASLGGSWDNRNPRTREYCRFMTKAGLPEELISFVLTPGERHRKTAYQALKNYLDIHGCPDALFCDSDETAMGAYRALCETGHRVPADLSLFGIDGIIDTQYLETPLTTVIQPIPEMCAAGWRLLKERMANPELPPRHETLTAKLDTRASFRDRSIPPTSP
jgi:LacI family transcriptional regulator